MAIADDRRASGLDSPERMPEPADLELLAGARATERDVRAAVARPRVSRRALVLMWLLWALVMVGYQQYVRARFAPDRPDDALSWTAGETGARSQAGKQYLEEPFFNDHVSWDSEYYLSIAVGGYDDPLMRAIPPDFSWMAGSRPGTNAKNPDWISMNHAFFPFYPMLIRAVAFPLQQLGMGAIAAAALGGVLVSLLGTLGAMLALYDLARDELDGSTGLRAAFYLVIFPAGMFLAQVYTEGLFLGLSFGALALARRRSWLLAGLLAAGATLTRASGALLLLPLGLYWLQEGNLRRLREGQATAALSAGVPLLLPLAAYLVWNAQLGEPFHIVERNFFDRQLLAVGRSLWAWKEAWVAFTSDNLQSRAYYLVEFAAIVLAVVCSALMWRRDRALAIYGLIAILFPLTTGVAMGMHRYAMAAPALFLIPARWGRHEAVDRGWTLASVLLMGVFAAMFSFDFWAG